MKKFFSLMCAIAIVFSASASPAKVLGKSKQVEAVESMKTEKTFKAMQPTRLQKAERTAVAFRAPQEAYNVTIAEYSEKFYASDNDVWVRLYDAAGTCYSFDVVVAEGTNELVLGQTYTSTDMIANYTCMYDQESNKVMFTDATLTKTLVDYEEQQLVRFDATATDENGNTYTIVYEEAPFIITGDTIEVAFTEHMNKPIYAQGLCQMRTDDGVNDIAFTFPCAEGQPAGTYTEDDVELQYTFVNDLEAKAAHCVVTDVNGTINLEGWILARDGNVYHVTMFFTVPTPQSQVTITATNLVLDDSYASWFGVIIASASNENYEVEMYLDATNYVGTFDAEEVELSIADTNGAIELYSGSVTVANTADGVAVTGTALSMDGVEYTLNLSYVIPDATSTEDLALTGVITVYEGEAWQFLGQTATKMATIAAYSSNVAGTYGRSDLMADYTYVIKVVGNDTLPYLMVDANITVAVSGNNATITGTLKGQNYNNQADVVAFNLNLTATLEDYVEPTGNEYDAQDEAFKHVFADYTLDDQYLAKYSVFVVEATDATDNSHISIEFNVAEGATELAAGVYPISDSYDPGTVSAGTIDQYIYGSFAGTLDAEGYINIPLWLFNEGNVTILENGIIQVKATNTWGAQIECQLGSWGESIDNTNAEIKAQKAIRNGQLIIIKNGVEYNAQGASLK